MSKNMSTLELIVSTILIFLIVAVAVATFPPEVYFLNESVPMHAPGR